MTRHLRSMVVKNLRDLLVHQDSFIGTVVYASDTHTLHSLYTLRTRL